MVFRGFEDEFDFNPGALNAEARNNLIRNTLTDERFGEITQTQARQIFRDAGFRFRDSVFNSIFNEVMGRIGLTRELRSLGPDAIPPERLFDTPKGGLPTRYSFIVEYYTTDAEGNEFKRYTTFRTSEPMTVGDILGETEAFIYNSDGERYAGEISSLSLNKAFIDPTQPIKFGDE